jgi:hypothetical protein
VLAEDRLTSGVGNRAPQIWIAQTLDDRISECVNAVSNKEIEAVLVLQALGTDCCRNNALLHGPCFQDLLAHPGAKAQRNDDDSGLGQLRTYVLDKTSDGYTGETR